MLRQLENVCKGKGTSLVCIKLYTSGWFKHTVFLIFIPLHFFLSSSRHCASFCLFLQMALAWLQQRKEHLSLVTSERWKHSESHFSAGKRAFYLTCSYLEGRDGLFQADWCLSVTAGADLRVEGGHVEQDAGLLQRQVLLAYRHSCERVVPEGKWWNVCFWTPMSHDQYSLLMLSFYVFITAVHCCLSVSTWGSRDSIYVICFDDLWLFFKCFEDGLLSLSSFPSLVSAWRVPGEEDASLVRWGEESALHQRKVTEVLCQEFHPGLVSTWRSASLRHQRKCYCLQ